MEPKEEYQDPDYPSTSKINAENTYGSEPDKIQKIKKIVRREFANELIEREFQISRIDQRLSSGRHLLQRLRYALVTKYYQDPKLQLTTNQIQDEVASQSNPGAKAEVSKLLLTEQRRPHPSVCKLVGKKNVDMEEIFRHRAPRNRVRKDYSAMVQSKNKTIPADSTKTLRPETITSGSYNNLKRSATEQPSGSRPKKIPRQKDPQVENVVKCNEVTRNRQKHRYRIIIGNTSKYAPPASRADRSTHKWLLYVRALKGSIESIVTAVTVQLHHSYAPHDIVHVAKPPYHVSRRGWGEFPAKVKLYFALPDRNRPTTVEHTIKLDRNFTGLQTLGSETIVDVWLYSDEDMLQYEFKDDILPSIMLKPEPVVPEPLPPPPPPPPPQPVEAADSNKELDSWLDFFNNDTTELDVDEMIIKTVKTEEPEKDETDNSAISKEFSLDLEFDKSSFYDLNESLFDGRLKCEPEDEMPMCDFNNLDQVDNIDNVASIDTQLKKVSDLDKYDENIPSEILSQPPPTKKRIMKYVDQTTGKFYYLEMDRKLDLNSVQEIVINTGGKIKTAKISPINPENLKNIKKRVKKSSLMKPNSRSLLNKDYLNLPLVIKPKLTKYKHIELDHCYLGVNWVQSINFPTDKKNLPPKPHKPVTTYNRNSHRFIIPHTPVVKKEVSLYDKVCETVKRFTSVRTAVIYLLSKIPLVSEMAKNTEYLKYFPFTVGSTDYFWKLDYIKRKNIEWSRATIIQKILLLHFKKSDVWRPKQILVFARIHGYYLVKEERVEPKEDTATGEWSSWNDLERTKTQESLLKKAFPTSSHISSLTDFDLDNFMSEDNNSATIDTIDLATAEEEVDVVNDIPAEVKKEPVAENSANLTPLPVEDQEDRLRFMYIERKCADIGIELKNEDVGHGFSYSAVHAVMLAALKKFAEELIRGALAAKIISECQATSKDIPLPVWTSKDAATRDTVGLQHAWAALRGGRLATALGGRGLGTRPPQDHPL